MELSADMLNSGLDLSMEFGEHWLADIRSRWAAIFPDTSIAMRDECARICKEVNRFAHEWVLRNPVMREGKAHFPEVESFRQVILKKYPWISAENLSRLYSQSCYYAWK